MWNEIACDNDLKNFMKRIGYFHDSCIKEIRYLSGAYVGKKLSMYPINDRRVLSVIIQRQYEDLSMIEMEFTGLKYLNLVPADDKYTCDIFESTMAFKDGFVYWCDSDIPESEISSYGGTLVCAKSLRWRCIDGCMGADDFFVPIK